MKVRASLIGCMLAVTPVVALAQSEPKLNCTKDVTYSQAFLAKYPKAPAWCREVVMKNGEKWVRFDAKVTEVKGDQVSAAFMDELNNPSAPLTFNVNPKAHLTVGGKEVKFSSLSKGDDLSIWLPASHFSFWAKPSTDESFRLATK